MTTTPSGHNVLLTGVPRSGTTLICYLLNKLPDTVALDEPLPVRGLGHHVVNEIDGFLQATRTSLLESGTAVSKHVDGRVPDNPFEDAYPGLVRWLADRLRGRQRLGPDAGTSLRRLRVSRGVIAIEKRLSSDFLLCIKHPAAFTALLDHLTPHFCCYAVVRNPLSTLASWNSCRMSMRNGYSPTAELFDPDLAQALALIDDRFDRQFYLLSWFFGRYREILAPENILRYEDIVDSHGAVLEAITPRAAGLREALETRNANRLYDRALVQDLGSRLLKTDGPFWEFYTRSDVEQVLEKSSK